MEITPWIIVYKVLLLLPRNPPKYRHEIKSSIKKKSILSPEIFLFILFTIKYNINNEGNVSDSMNRAPIPSNSDFEPSIYELTYPAIPPNRKYRNV